MPFNQIHILIGAWDSTVISTEFLTGYEYRRFELGSKKIWPKYGNFLDYEPYTTLSIYIPYCGSMKLDTSIFMGHNCKITMNVNTRTGEVMAIIFVDNIEYASLQGDTSIDLPVQGLAASQYNGQKKQLQYAEAQLVSQTATSTLGYATGMTISASMDNTAGAVMQAGMLTSNLINTAIQDAKINYELSHVYKKERHH